MELRLLGTISLTHTGESVRLHSSKSLALLAYLGVEDDIAHTRAKLATLLWGDSDEKRARHSLRQALHSVRQVMDAHHMQPLETDRETVRYHPNAQLRIDAQQFMKLAEAGDWQGCVDLYQGPLMDGFDVTGSAQFEEWLFLQRMRFEQQAIRGLQELITSLLQERAYGEALRYAQRLVEIDRLHEEGHRILMTIYIELGNPDAARRQFKLCEQLLAEELGVRPSPETMQLYNELLPGVVKPTGQVLEDDRGHLDSVTEYLSGVADQAARRHEYSQATDLYTRAIIHQKTHHPRDLAHRFDLLIAREAMLDRQGRRLEQSDDIEALVALARELDDDARKAQVYLRQAGYYTYTGDYQSAHVTGERALNLFRAIGDRDGEAQALRELGFMHWSAENYTSALDYGKRVLALHRQSGDTEGEATALHNLAEIYRALGNPSRAETLYEQAIQLLWATKNKRGQGLALHGLSHALRQSGRLEEALQKCMEAHKQFVAANDRLMISRMHHTLAGLYWEQGEVEQAIEQIELALGYSRDISYGPGMAHGLVTAGHLYALNGNGQKAQLAFENALIWFSLIGDMKSCEVIAQLLNRLGSGTIPRQDLVSGVGWVRGHVVSGSGKIYCEFESPMARERRTHRQD